LTQINSGVEVTSQPIVSSVDHTQHIHVAQSGDSSSQPIMQSQSQPVLPQQPSLPINSASQPAVSTQSSGTPVGDTASTQSVHSSTTKTDDTKSEANDDGDR
jgi:hypothetical protein